MNTYQIIDSAKKHYLRNAPNRLSDARIYNSYIVEELGGHRVRLSNVPNFESLPEGFWIWYFVNIVVVEKLRTIIKAIKANTVEAWQDNLEEQKKVVILEDFDKRVPGGDNDPTLIYSYNRWCDNLSFLFHNEIPGYYPNLGKS